MKKKLFPLLLISGGLLFILMGLWEIFAANKAQTQALEQAKVAVEAQHITTNSPAKNERKNDEFIQQPPNIEAPLVQAEIGDTIGILNIPKIHSEYPIIYGVGEDELEVGVGHYPGTAFPTQNNQVVLAGHRDSVFSKLGELKEGDKFIVEMPYGSFEYIMEESYIVDKDDRTVIVPTYPKEVLTVITCYPFSYVGNAPKRYIINAVPYKKQTKTAKAVKR